MADLSLLAPTDCIFECVGLSPGTPGDERSSTFWLDRRLARRLSLGTSIDPEPASGVSGGVRDRLWLVALTVGEAAPVPSAASSNLGYCARRDHHSHAPIHSWCFHSARK